MKPWKYMTSISFLLAFGIIGIADGQDQIKSGNNSQRQPVVEKRISFPTFGVSLIPPEHWTRIPEGGAGHIARWAILDEKTKALKCAIITESEPAEGRSLKQYCDHLAKRTGMQIVNDSDNIDGSKAIYLERINPASGFASVGGWVTLKGNYFYTISAWYMPGAPFRETLTTFRDLWKWIDPVPPHTCIEYYPQPKACFSGLIYINLPTLLRPYPVQDRQHEMCMGLYDYTCGSTIFFCNMTEAPMPNGFTEEILNQITSRFEKQFHLTSKLTWKKIGKASNIYVSPQMKATLQQGSQKKEELTQWGIVDVGNKAVLFTFTTHTDSSRLANFYAKVANTIMESVQLNPPQSTTPASGQNRVDKVRLPDRQ